jgi:hypothetical protein
MVIKSKFMRLFGALAFTVCPFIFIQPGLSGEEGILKHERVHLKQQLWFGVIGSSIGAVVLFVFCLPFWQFAFLPVVAGTIEGWVLGQFAWRFLYLAVLPTKWNPFRRYWETQAFLAQGFDKHQIKDMLKNKPYYLS